jgi:polyhydroxybutyrate depolymerase
MGDASCMRYEGCTDESSVELCTIEGGGHTWPGGTPMPEFGKTSSDIQANEWMWQFFLEHSP